jgi:hypothetical protein
VFAVGRSWHSENSNGLIKAKLSANILAYLKARESGKEKVDSEAVGLKLYKKAMDLIIYHEWTREYRPLLSLTILFGCL